MSFFFINYKRNGVRYQVLIQEEVDWFGAGSVCLAPDHRDWFCLFQALKGRNQCSDVAVVFQLCATGGGLWGLDDLQEETIPDEMVFLFIARIY